MGIWERRLSWLLRLGGGVMLLALLAMLMPTAWMERTNASLGLAPLPRLPLVEYLTRSLSLLYGLHGGLLWVAGGAPLRLRPVVAYLGWSNLFFALAILVIDLEAGMPAFWAWPEAGGVAIFGVLVLWLLRRAEAEGAPGAQGRRG